MRLIALLITATLIIFSGPLLADVAKPEPELAQTLVEEKTAKQCLKELEQEQSEQQKAEKNEDKEPSWFERTFNYHKLGSLHFQDIIELFY